MKFDQVLVEKAKETKSAEELLALAKENGIKLTGEESEQYFDQLHATGELADDELENVSGGGCGGGYSNEEILNEYYYQVGDAYRVGDCVYFDPGDGVKWGEITWKGYVTSQDAIMYRIWLRDSCWTTYDVKVNQLRQITHRDHREYNP